MNMIQCQGCQQSWSLNLQMRQAHPGYRMAELVTLPKMNPDGERMGGSRVHDSSRWVTEGASRTTARTLVGTETVWTWPCRCGRELAHAEPAMERVTCTYGTTGGPCEVARYVPTYSAGSYEPTCPCCDNGGHWVRLDRVDLPRCQR